MRRIDGFDPRRADHEPVTPRIPPIGFDDVRQTLPRRLSAFCDAGLGAEPAVAVPAHEVKVGEVYLVSKGPERKIIRVLGLLENRMDAKSVAGFYADETPVEMTSTFKSMFNAPVLKRDRGTGRPTKRDRREIDDLQDGFFVKDKEEE